MTNFQSINEMNLREMTGFLYTFLLPWTKAYTDEQKAALWKSLEKFLLSEVKTFKTVKVEDLREEVTK